MRCKLIFKIFHICPKLCQQLSMCVYKQSRQNIATALIPTNQLSALIEWAGGGPTNSHSGSITRCRLSNNCARLNENWRHNVMLHIDVRCERWRLFTPTGRSTWTPTPTDRASWQRWWRASEAGCQQCHLAASTSLSQGIPAWRRRGPSAERLNPTWGRRSRATPAWCSTRPSLRRLSSCSCTWRQVGQTFKRKLFLHTHMFMSRSHTHSIDKMYVLKILSARTAVIWWSPARIKCTCFIQLFSFEISY